MKHFAEHRKRVPDFFGQFFGAATFVIKRGFQSKFDIDRARTDDDLVIEQDNAVVLVESASQPFLAGSQVDFVDDLIGASFRVNNPNATASCGCGTSFSI